MPERSWFERLRSDEGGFTLIELLCAAGLCLVGLVAMMGAFDGSRGLVDESERNQVASHQAERALEDAISRPYDQIALSGTTTPPRSSDPNHPSNKVTTTGLYAYRTGQTAPFVMGGSLPDTLPHSSAWSQTVAGSGTSVRLSGTIYRYVTVYNDPAINPSTDDGRRITVAVTVANRRKAVTLSSIVRAQP